MKGQKVEINDIASAIFQYGGTVIMAVLFIWVFIQDKIKNTKLLEDNAKLLGENAKMVSALVESNKNIAKSLDIISSNLVTIDHKIDRNYEQELKNHDK